MFGLGILAKVGGWAVKAVGGHLLHRDALAGLNGVEAAATGLGLRFFLGAGAALYWTQPDVRAAIDSVITAVKNVIL